LLSGWPFQVSPSLTQSSELATSASCWLGVMARLTGGPTTVFISGRLATTRGLARSLMSMIDTVSLPGGLTTGLPVLSQPCFSSLPLMMSCACAAGDSSGAAVIARSASRDRFFMTSSLFLVGFGHSCRATVCHAFRRRATPGGCLAADAERPATGACYAQGQPRQDMIDAAETVLRDGRTHWRREAAARVAFLVDGEAYFDAFRAACLEARHVIRIIGWDIHSRMRLVPGVAADGLPAELGPFLNALLHRRPGLRIDILIWDFAAIYTIEREPLP